MRKTKLQAENSFVISSISADNVEAEEERDRPSYNPEFVNKILRSREDIKNGKGVKIDVENLWK
ncbi:DUF2683 family protein [Mucilaginibacter sp. CAU 1740]